MSPSRLRVGFPNPMWRLNSISVLRLEQRSNSCWVEAFCVCLLLALPGIAQERQTNPAATNGDDRAAQAAELAFDAGREASEITTRAESVSLQLAAARLLVNPSPNASLRLLDIAWDALTAWAEEEPPRKRKAIFVDLRRQALDLYLKLDPAKAERILGASSANEREKGREEATSDSSTQRQRADDLVQAGASVLESDPDRGVGMALSSLIVTGKISTKFSMIAGLLKNRNRDLLSRFEKALADGVSIRNSYDGQDWQAIVGLLYADPEMLPASRLAFFSFLLRSAERLAAELGNLRKDGHPSEVSQDAVDNAYFVLNYAVRKAFLLNFADKIPELDHAIEEIRAVTSPSQQDLVYGMTTSDSLEKQLERAIKTTEGSLRDSRLVRVASRALAGKSPKVDLASEAVAEIGDLKTKAALSDCVLLARVVVFAAKGDFLPAEKKATDISNLDWRAWALMALGSLQKDPDARLYGEALRILEKSSPSPTRAELAFLLAELWSDIDPAKPAEVIRQAIKYSNQVVRRPDSPSSALNNFFPNIGKLSLAPGQPSESLSDLELPPVVGVLAVKDWQDAFENTQAIQDVSLRVKYKLAISRAVLENTKAKQKLSRTAPVTP